LDEMKKCSRCKRSLPSDKIHFYARSGVKDGLVSACKECLGSKCFQKPIAREGYKFCSKCKRELPADEYHFHFNSRTNRLVSACKECAGYNFTTMSNVKAGYKKCGTCGEDLPATTEYFQPRGNAFVSRCRSCIALYLKKYGEINFDRLIKLRKERYALNPPDPEQWKTYYQNNRGTILERSKKWGIENNEKSIERSRIWYEKNKDRARENSIAWRNANPEKKKLSHQRRRTLKKSLASTLTKEQWEITLKHFDGACAYCGDVPKDGKMLQQDHFHPLAKNGELSIINAVPACGRCNSSKGKKLFSEWYPKFKYYSKEREKTVLEYLNYHNGIQQLALL